MENCGMTRLQKCPKCGGNVDDGDGLSCVVVENGEGIVFFEDDLGWVDCVGTDERAACGWSEGIGNWAGYERAQTEYQEWCEAAYA